MSDRNRIEYTSQEIDNLTLDNSNVDITALRGNLQYIDGSGWVRQPIDGGLPYEQFEYDVSNNVIYSGINGNYSAADGDTDWYITKFTWSGSNCTKKQRRLTSWTNRATGW